MSIRLVSGLVAAVLLSSVASAATVNVSSVTGTFTSAGPGDTFGLNGLGTSAINWGAPVTASGKSGYSFAGAGAASVNDNTPFNLGIFTHNNRTIASQDARTNYQPSSINGASLRLDYILDFGSGITRSFSSVFDITHYETPNQATTCANGEGHVGVNTNGCADRVEIVTNPNYSDSFKIGDLTYQLEVAGFDVDGPFWTEEDKLNVTSLFGFFNVTKDSVDGGPPPDPVTPVPLPATALLLIGALGAFGAISRRDRT